MFSLEIALILLAVVCIVGSVLKLILRRRLSEIDGMHEVHTHSPHIDSIGM